MQVQENIFTKCEGCGRDVAQRVAETYKAKCGKLLCTQCAFKSKTGAATIPHATGQPVEMKHSRGRPPKQEKKLELKQDPELQQEPAEQPKVPESLEKFKTVDAFSLFMMNLPPIKFIVSELIAAGLHILAGAPKIGKSFLVLYLCWCISTGRKFWGLNTMMGTTLYLCLEDNLNRIQGRMKDILQGEEPPANMHFSLMAQTIDNGLADQVRAWMKVYPDTRLIVIDTLQKVRGYHRNNDQYSNDYSDATKLKHLADEFSIAILLVHHLRKMSDADVFNTVSGSTGLTGCVDGTFVVKKEDRKAVNATLYGTGRDIEEIEYLISFNKSTCRWELLSTDASAWQDEQGFFENPIVILLKRLINEKNTSWKGTPSELHLAMVNLMEGSEDLNFPSSSSVLGKRIFELIYKLARIGISVRTTRDKKRYISIAYKMPSEPSEPSEPSVIYKQSTLQDLDNDINN